MNNRPLEDEPSSEKTTPPPPPPQNTGYTVYTKENCKYCTLVKKLLENEPNHVVECDLYLQQDKAGFLKTMEEWTHLEWKTFPIVFYNHHFIGGYNETKIHYHKHHLSFEEWEHLREPEPCCLVNRVVEVVPMSDTYATVFPTDGLGGAVCTCLTLPCTCGCRTS